MTSSVAPGGLHGISAVPETSAGHHVIELGAQHVVSGGDARKESRKSIEKSYSQSCLGLAMEGGLRIVFKNLVYSVPSSHKRGETAVLVRNVSGWLEPFQMAALMGPSGSGKTTILDLMAGRKTEGKMEGTLLFGGKPPSKQFLRRYTGYVEQFDTLLSILTVEEMILYTAELKRQTSESLESKKLAVANVLKKLGLESCRDVKIGNNEKKGISGGQSKRTNIAIAIITHPRVLFLDEPTTGLDSYTANEVMKVVRNLRDDGTTICATIHSPSQFTFSLFDRLMVLVQGQVVFFGPTNEGPHFCMGICEQVKEPTANYTDVEFLVDLITEADRSGQGEVIAAQYAASSLCKENERQVDVFLNNEQKLDDDLMSQLGTKSSTMTPWYHGLVTLIKYRTTRNYRDPEFLGPRIGDKIFVSLLMMTLYLSKGNDFSDTNYGNISALLFAWIILPSYGAASYVPTLVMERDLFSRERSDGLYHVITYLLYKLFEELLLNMTCSAAIAAYTFYGIQFQGQFVLFWLVYWVMLSIGVVAAYLIAAVAPNLDAANAMLPAYVSTWVFFAGFLIKNGDMRWYWKWYSFIVPLKYTWGSLMVNQYSGKMGDPVWGGNEGNTVLEVYSLEHVDKWAFLGYSSLFFLAYFLLTWFIMSVKKYESR